MSDLNGLSDRELDVLRLIATGASNKQIANDLSISQNTVKVHIRNIFSKTGVASRTEAAIFAVQRGIVEPSAVPPAPPEAGGQEKAGFLDWKSRPVWQRFGLAGAGILILLLILAAGALLYQAIIGSVGSQTASLSTESLERWQANAALGLPRSGLALAAYENQLYAIGGEASDGIVAEVERYNPVSDAWESLASKPTPVRDVSAVVIGGRIYVPGGLQSDGALSNQLEIYDPSRDEWLIGSPLPAGVSAYAAVAFEGSLYMFGGWDGEHYLNSVYRYDPDSDRWEPMTPMPTSRGFSGAAESDGRIFVVGGSDGARPLDTNEAYTPEAEGQGRNPWQEADPLPEPASGLGVASLAEIIHVVGGVRETGESIPYKYFPQDGRWEPFEPSGPADWTGLGLAPVESQIHAVGGSESGEPTARHMSYVAIYTISIPIIQ